MSALPPESDFSRFHPGGTTSSDSMWKGRFAKETSSLVEQFGESISYDWRLFPHDVAGSISHARAQKNAGLPTEDEFWRGPSFGKHEVTG